MNSRRRTIPRTAALAAAAAACVPLLAGCAVDNLQGQVTAKTVRPGYTYTYMQPIYTESCSGGKYTSCTDELTGMVPIVYTVPTCYQITVTGVTSGDTCLDADRWQKTNVGDHYTGPDVQPKDRQRQVRKSQAR